jgi:hypothetical protein
MVIAYQYFSVLCETMKRPTTEIQKAVFVDLYDAFKLIKLDWKSKYAGFERVLLDSKLVDHWVITGITHDALKVVSSNGFSKKNPGVVRGHSFNRKDRAKKLFDGDGFPASEEAFDYFMANDRVTLITKSENGVKKTKSDWSKIYTLDSNLFPYRSGYSARYTDEALKQLKLLAKENHIINVYPIKLGNNK